MKKYIFAFLCFFTAFNCFAVEQRISHSYNPDYSFFPETKYKDYYIKNFLTSFEVNYCVQSIFEIPRGEAAGYSCEDIIQKLDQMGGLDKECFGVSYIDANTGERKPIFKKSSFVYSENINNSGELYVKDKAAGGLYFDVNIEKFIEEKKSIEENNVYAVCAVLNRSPTNFFVRGIKKNEAGIFVLMQETDSLIRVYAVMECTYCPQKVRFLQSFVENAVSARVLELENWFYRMLCTKQ